MEKYIKVKFLKMSGFNQLQVMQEQLMSMQQRYTDLYQQQQAAMDGDIDLVMVSGLWQDR